MKKLLLIISVFVLGIVPNSFSNPVNHCQWDDDNISTYKDLQLSGYVKFINDHSPVLGATVTITNLDTNRSENIITDVNGYYSKRLSPGHYRVTISYIGYNDLIYEIEIDENGDHRIVYLTPGFM